MMRALITGCTGFVGSHLLRRALDQDTEVAVLIQSNSNTWRISDLLSKVHVINGSLENIAATKREILNFQPEVIFHLGWFGVGSRYKNDVRQLQNVSGSVELLKICSETGGCKRWIGVGSQAEYGPHEKKIKEDFYCKPTTLYGAAKLSTCLLTQRLCDIYGIKFNWLRLFSPYGPCDEPGWLIPYIILNLLQNKKPAMTLGEQKWDYVYVKDAVDALWRVANSNACGIFNLASGEASSVRNIAERIRNYIDASLPLGIGEIPYGKDQIMHLQADITKLKEIGWTPETDLESGLYKTVEWFKSNYKKYSWHYTINKKD
jgi:nucleoside-diphosphate-sugar epimerase